MAKKTCILPEALAKDPLIIKKTDLKKIINKNQMPASEVKSFLEALNVKDGEIKNITSAKVIQTAKAFFDEYKIAKNPNYDNVSLRELSKEIIGKDNKFIRFGAMKLFAPVYYVLSKGGPKSKALSNKLLDFDVSYTMDKSFADYNLFQINKILGKNANNLELLEPEMRNQTGRTFTSEQRKAMAAFDLKNPKTNKLWKSGDEGFEKLNDFTKDHIVAKEYHKQVTDFYWERTKEEVKIKLNKFQYEKWLKDFDDKYIKNYMTRAISPEVLSHIHKHGNQSPVIVKVAKKRLLEKAKKSANSKFNKKDNPINWEVEFKKVMNDTDLFEQIKVEAINILTYNPGRVVNQHFKKRGVLLDFETEILDWRGNKKKVRTYMEDYKSVMDRYGTVSSKFLATTRYFPEFTNFGKKYKMTGGAKAGLWDIEAADGAQAMYVKNHIDDLLGLGGMDKGSNAFVNFLGSTSTLSAAIGLSSPTSGIKNLLITIPRMMGTFNLIQTGKAFLRFFQDPNEIWDKGRREGFLTYQTKSLQLQDKKIKLPFNLGEFNMEKLFNFNLMTQTEGLGRVTQVMAGLQTFELQLDKIHGVKNIFSKGKKSEVTYFWKNVFKLSDDEIAFLSNKKNYRDILNGLQDKASTAKMDFIKAKISHYSHVSTSGGTGAQLLPAWMNNRAVKPMTLFYRMAYSTSFDMYLNTLKPIRKHGNLAPLARAALGSTISGALLWGMYDLLFDVKNPEENTDNWLGKASSYLWRAEFLQLGSDFLNPYSPSPFTKDFYNFTKLNDDMLAQSFNPVYGTAVYRNIVSAASLVVRNVVPAAGGARVTTLGQSMDDFLNNTVVLYAQYRKNFNEPFGLSWKKDKLYKTSKKFSTFANKWRIENGYVQNKSGWGGMSEKTPYYRSLRNAFYNGSQKDFNRAYWAAYNYMATEMIKGFRKEGRGVTTQEIHKKVMGNMKIHLSAYSVTGLSSSRNDKGIIPDLEFKKYLKTPELLKEYEQAQKDFLQRKNRLLNNTKSREAKEKYSIFYNQL